MVTMWIVSLHTFSINSTSLSSASQIFDIQLY